MHYILEFDSNGGVSCDVLDRPEPEPDSIRFNKGKPVAEELPVMYFTKAAGNKGDLLDYVPTALPGLLISGKFKEALASSGASDMQYFPAVIKDEAAGKEYSDYYVANIVGLFACVDMEKSDYRASLKDPAKIRTIYELRLDPGKLPDVPIFRLYESISTIVVNDAIQKAAGAAGLRGVKYTPADGYAEL